MSGFIHSIFLEIPMSLPPLPIWQNAESLALTAGGSQFSFDPDSTYSVTLAK